jgi:hypothetical protein
MPGHTADHRSKVVCEGWRNPRVERDTANPVDLDLEIDELGYLVGFEDHPPFFLVAVAVSLDEWYSAIVGRVERP